MAHGDLLALAFGLGWAAADRAHLPALPEALALALDVPGVRMAIVHWNGTLLMEYMYPPMEERGGESNWNTHEIEENLGAQYALQLGIEHVEPMSEAQLEILGKSVKLIHAALDCILIQQQDRGALGEPFTRLSDREWQICMAFEGPDGEKQIADSLSCSRHTIHSYVKSVYRKLQVQSRLQLLDQLKRAREQVRRVTLEGFTSGRNEKTGDASESR